MNSEKPAPFRRKYPRRSYQRAVGLLHHGQYQVSMSGEIGEGGMSIDTTLPLALGDEVVVSFCIPGGSFICLRAVVKVDEAGVPRGLEFTDIRFSHKREIRTYVAARSNSLSS